MRTTEYVPSYSHHKASGQAVDRLDGRDIYLGKWKSAESRAEYRRTVAEWMAAGRRLPVPDHLLTVAEMVLAFRAHAKTYYGASAEPDNYDEACKPLTKLYGKTPAIAFGPLRLETVREEMIHQEWSRNYINRQAQRICHVFKWAASKEMIPASVYEGIRTLAGLKAGRSGATETEPVKPVAIQHVNAILPHVSDPVAAMIRLQLLTGMRPAEVCSMRTSDIDTTGKIWGYRPAQHKTLHHGHKREVFMGPQAQEVLKPHLKTELSAFIFSPAEAEAARRASLHDIRTTPLSCGNRPGTNRARRAKRKPGIKYTIAAYRRAITRACDKAFPPPPQLEQPDQAEALATWRADHRWHPHQLRHTAGTELRRTHGLEAAQVILGHKTLKVTELYAEKNVQQALRIMSEVG